MGIRKTIWDWCLVIVITSAFVLGKSTVQSIQTQQKVFPAELTQSVESESQLTIQPTKEKV